MSCYARRLVRAGSSCVLPQEMHTHRGCRTALTKSAVGGGCQYSNPSVRLSCGCAVMCREVRVRWTVVPVCAVLVVVRSGVRGSRFGGCSAQVVVDGLAADAELSGQSGLALAGGARIRASRLRSSRLRARRSIEAVNLNCICAPTAVTIGGSFQHPSSRRSAPQLWRRGPRRLRPGRAGCRRGQLCRGEGRSACGRCGRR
jgi:hypothetical protein